MNHSTNRKELFRIPAAAEKLSLFQDLFDLSEIHTDLALALLKVIHRELGEKPLPDPSMYRRYAGVIQSLRYGRSDMFQAVVEAWKAGRSAREIEWLSDGVIK